MIGKILLSKDWQDFFANSGTNDCALFVPASGEKGDYMYNGIVFDIDGTILNTEKAVISSLQKLLKAELDTEYSADELAFVLGIPGAVALQHFAVSDITAASQKWNEYLKEFYHSIHVFAGLEEIIKTMQGLPIQMGIVTSKTKQELVDDFYPFGLQSYFDPIVCADDTTKHKPEPEPILKWLELAKSLPEETLYIGDTVYDRQCADKAGVDFALALWGTKDPNMEATIKLNHPREIVEYIRK